MAPNSLQTERTPLAIQILACEIMEALAIQKPWQPPGLGCVGNREISDVSAVAMQAMLIMNKDAYASLLHKHGKIPIKPVSLGCAWHDVMRLSVRV